MASISSFIGGAILLALSPTPALAACTTAYYACNPTNVSVGSDVAWVPPHNAVIRWSYTVPNGRRAMVGGMVVRVYRDGIPLGSSFAGAEIYVKKNGLTQVTILDVVINNPALMTEQHETVDAGIILLAGDRLEALDDDSSSGGTVRYTETALITEFDA